MILRSPSILFKDSPMNARAGYYISNRSGVMMHRSARRNTVTQFDDSGRVICHKIIRPNSANDN